MIDRLAIVVCLLAALCQAADPDNPNPDFLVGKQPGQYNLVRFNSLSYGSVPGVQIEMTDNDPKRPATNAIDGSIYSSAATTGGCSPCTLILRLPGVFFINRMTIWNVRNPTPGLETTLWERFRNIQVEIALDLTDPTNMSAFEFNVFPYSKYVSPVYNPSPLLYSEDPSVRFRKIDVDLRGRAGGGVLGNIIRIRRLPGKTPSADERQLTIGDLDIYGIEAKQCVYSPWSPPISEDIMCYRTIKNNVVNVRYSQIREVLVDSNYGLPSCDQDDLYREVVISNPDLVRACLDPPARAASAPVVTPPCNYSYWSSWTQCTAQSCGYGTQTRTRTYINTGDCGPKDTVNCPLTENRQCTAYTEYPCPVVSDNACAVLFLTNVTAFQKLVANQLCVDSLWTASQMLFDDSDTNIANWIRYPGDVTLKDSFEVATDFMIGGTLILPPYTTFIVRSGATLRISGDLYISQNATFNISSSSLLVSGTAFIDGTFLQHTFDTQILIAKYRLGSTSVFDAKEMSAKEHLRLCETIEYELPVAVYGTVEGKYGKIIHSCNYTSDLGNITMRYEEGTMSLVLQPPPPPPPPEVNLVPVLIGSIIGGLAFLIAVIVVAVLLTGVHRDPYDQLAESQSKGKGSNYLIMV